MVVARLHALAPHLDGEPDPGFRAATRARLVAMAAVRTPDPAPVPRVRRLLSPRVVDAAPSGWRTRLTAGLTGAALGVTAVAAVVAVAAVAAGAGPGDLLYDVKLGTEQTHLALAGDSRGHTLLNLAGTRLAELQELASADAGLVISTLGTMDDQTTEGASWLTVRAVAARDEGALDDLEHWAAGQSAGLSALRDDVPPSASDEVDHSLMLLSGIAGRAAALRTALDCAGGPATKGTDALGPVPARCPPAAAAPPAAGGPATGGATTGGATTGGATTGGATTGGTTTGGTTTAPGTGSASVPSVSPPAAPSIGGSPGRATGTPGTSGLPLPTVPTPPTVGGHLPIPTDRTLPAPRVSVGGGQSPSTSSPRIGVHVCAPPLATIGDC